MRDSWGKGWMRKFVVGAAWVFFAIGLGSPSPLRAQVTGTTGFETGLQKLTTVDMNIGDGATVNWNDGTSTPGLLDCDYGALHPFECDILGTHVYAKTGVHSISISYTSPGPLGSGETANATANISAPGPFVILTIGDSIASGQGTPDINYAPADSVSEGYWDDTPSDYDSSGGCARSSKSGFVEAQNEVQSNNPAITTIAFACTGDTVQDTINALHNARKVLPRIDVLLISVGADNIDGGFGNFITTCLEATPATPCSDNTTFTNQVGASINNLSNCDRPQDANCYPNLAKEINCIDPDTGMQDTNCADPQAQIPKLVLITEYMDITHDQTGNYPSVAADPTCDFALAALAGDWQFFYEGYLIPLNQQVSKFPMLAATAGLAVPTYAVTGMQDDFFLHGYCAGHPSGERWINDIADSEAAIGLGVAGGAGTGHPDDAGEADYKSHIYNAIVAYNPPVTTAIATTADGAAYTFGAWTNQDVDISLSSINAIKESGVGSARYAVDNANCFSPGGTGAGNCTEYTGPITVSSSGQHTVAFFGTNAAGNPEESHSARVLIDKSPPLSMNPGTQTIDRRQIASYTVAIGHAGWENQTVNLSCETGDARETCTMSPPTVTLNQASANTAVAVVTREARGMAVKPGAPAQPIRLQGREALRALLALATGLFVASAALALWRRRWAQVSGFAALAVVLGALCVGCGAPSPKTYTVTVTGVSGDTTNTASSILIVK